MMRVVVVVVLAIYLHLVGAEANNNILIYGGGDSPGIAADDTGPTNIIGRNGRCVDVADHVYANGNPIIMWPCGNARGNQLWTFRSDGTIRCQDKCLTTAGFDVGSRIVIYDCASAAADATKWKSVNAGTIMNPRSGLVLTAENGTQRTQLTLAEDINSSSQAWTPVNFTRPVIKYIYSEHREKCIQGNCLPGNAGLCLADCVTGTEPRQQWALYGDRTIRLFSDQNLCVTARGTHILYITILFPCQGLPNQRWTFMPDSTILNPNATLVIDDWPAYPSFYALVLYTPTGSPTQNWSLV